VWRDRIPVDQKAASFKTLAAFDQLLSIVNFGGARRLGFPHFSSENTYPLGKLISLLPANVLEQPLLAILQTDNNPTVLQFAAWCIGILNHPAGSDVRAEIARLRKFIQVRRNKIGEFWPLVDRQILYTEAQLGGMAAQYEFIRKLREDDVSDFEVTYNLRYYSHNQGLMEYRFVRRLEEGARTDQGTIEIVRLIYQKTRVRLAYYGDRPSPLLPKLWTGK
jgi:hypothetical protein